MKKGFLKIIYKNVFVDYFQRKGKFDGSEVNFGNYGLEIHSG